MLRKNGDPNVYLTLNRVTVSKVDGYEKIRISNANSKEVSFEYRLFGVRIDGMRPDLLIKDRMTLREAGHRDSVKEVATGFKHRLGFYETYYAIVADLIFPRQARKKATADIDEED
jgi:hypothetical protein